jgi:predicted transcriptional regulator
VNEATQLITTLLSSDVKGELLVLFHRNTGLVDTVEGVARRIGRTGLSIENDVRDLVKLGVLKTKKIGTSEVILLDRNKDREVLETVANHVKTIKGSGN